MAYISSAYRLQLNQAFTFYDAQKVIPYLANLGIDALYLSPIFSAKRGSTHCYDVTDPNIINPELGGETGFDALVTVAHAHSMKIIVDVVANHMAASIENPWWRDVLENGSSSVFSSFFDINWKPPQKELRGKILVPYLPMPYHEVLESGGIRLTLREEGICVEAGFHRLPCNPELYGRIFQRTSLDESVYRSVLKHLERVKKSTTQDEKKERASAVAQVKHLLSKLVVEHSKEVIETLEIINASQSLLSKFLVEQHYRLEYWQAGFEYINYRRFFDINELVALNAEDEQVFEACHKTLFRLYDAGLIDGLRIDHPDGLRDPKRYFDMLKNRGCRFLLVEKILELDEPLRNSWGVEGTVGYEYLVKLFGLFVHRAHENQLTQIYHAFIEQDLNQEELLYDNKYEYAAKYMASEIAALAHTYSIKGIDAIDLQVVLLHLFAVFPVYRTYFSKEYTEALDEKYMHRAFDLLRRVEHKLIKEVVDEVKSIFLSNGEQKELLYRFQQISPPIMAKGLEDTHLYQYNRLLCLNEVGGAPHVFGTPPEAFHAQNEEVLRHHPLNFTTANTHDTKRSDEVRLRISCISEVPKEWERLIHQLSSDVCGYKGYDSIHKNLEYFFYQTLVGILPTKPPFSKSLVTRIQEYMKKAAREAKEKTNWVIHNTAFEKALSIFIDEVFRKDSSPFFMNLLPFVEKCAEGARRKRISALLLRMGSPGVFECYQGTEIPVFALVDPDNRRQVDFEFLEHSIAQLKNKTTIPSTETEEKLYYFTRFLSFRKKYSSTFIQGGYIPLGIEGDQCIGYIRNSAKCTFLVLATVYTMHDHRPDDPVSIPKKYTEKKWRDLFTKKVHSLKEECSAQDILHGKPATVLFYES